LRRKTYELWEKLNGTDIEVAREQFLEKALPIL
jgi:hypothetical protein